jgi:hypothetical protein
MAFLSRRVFQIFVSEEKVANVWIERTRPGMEIWYNEHVGRGEMP